MPPAATAWGSIKYCGCSSGVDDSVDRKFCHVINPGFFFTLAGATWRQMSGGNFGTGRAPFSTYVAQLNPISENAGTFSKRCIKAGSIQNERHFTVHLNFFKHARKDL